MHNIIFKNIFICGIINSIWNISRLRFSFYEIELTSIFISFKSYGKTKIFAQMNSHKHLVHIFTDFSKLSTEISFPRYSQA